MLLIRILQDISGNAFLHNLLVILLSVADFPIQIWTSGETDEERIPSFTSYSFKFLVFLD